MNEIVITAALVLMVVGGLSAVILYFIAQKFKVIENPKIDEVEQVLPAANCGGCGFPGCRAFAEAVVKKESLEGLFCPVGGNDLIKVIAPILGIQAVERNPQIAVLRCSGSKVNAPKKVAYDGAVSCAFVSQLFAGESGCSYGCVGQGDCVVSCDFDAMYMDTVTGLPIIKENCIACGACVKACPKQLLELRNKGKKDRRIYVSCMNQEKGGIAKKNCIVACIGCGKCEKVCAFGAITIINNLAYIDAEKCTLCRKCVLECPTNSIHELNFPERKIKVSHQEEAEEKRD